MGRTRRYFAYAATAVLFPAAVTAALAGHRMANVDTLGQGTRETRGALPTPNVTTADGKRVAVILVSNELTEITDLLAPYAILSASGAFDVYTVAPERQTSDVWPGVSILPDLSFADFDARFPQGVDLIVVPYFGDYANPTLVHWLRRHTGGAYLLSICEGGRTAAAAGLLAGRRATSHFYALGELRSTFPDTDWVADARTVVDGTVISSAGVTAAIDATLIALRTLAGDGPYTQAVNTLGYRPRDHDARPSGMSPGDIVGMAMRAAYDWHRSDIGVVLAPGVDEIRLAAHLDTHPRTLVARTMTLGIDGTPIRSRFGMTLYPRGTLATAPPLDRVMRPDGARYDAAGEALLQQWATARGLRIEGESNTPPLRAYDEQLADITVAQGEAASRLVAKLIEYPTQPLRYPSDGDRFALLAVQPVALAFLGVAFTRRVTRRRPDKEKCS